MPPTPPRRPEPGTRPDPAHVALALLGVPPAARERFAAAETTKPKPGEILLYGPIMPDGWIWDDEGTSAVRVRQALAGAGDVTVRIHSPGGDLFEAVAIATALRQHRAAGHAVEAVVDGLAASAATVVMVACASVAAATLANIMLHQPRGCMCGTAADHAEMAAWLDTQTTQLAAAYAARMGRPAAEIAADLAAGDQWYTAAEAVAAGLVDRLLDDEPDPPPADPPPPVMARMIARRAALTGLDATL